jgi:N utilization substance protein A
MSSPITQAIRQVCEEKGLSYEVVLETIKAALAAAYRKDFGEKNQNIKIEFDPESGQMRVFDVKTIVEDMELESNRDLADEHISVTSSPSSQTDLKNETEKNLEKKDEERPKFNPKTMIMLSAARKIKPDAQVGEEIRFELKVPGSFGRIAAQTAKQVITQKLREAERQTVYNEFKTKEGEIITGIIGRKEGRTVLIDLGKTTAILPPSEQIEGEIYKSGVRQKFYILSVTLTSKGPEVIVSRAHPEMVKKIFALEIPEIQSGVVEIKSIAREAGSRTKIAVTSNVPNIDPIGACIGQRGSRIQTIINELGGEKIDVIKWEEDPIKFIINALSPAKILKTEINEKEKSARVSVAPDQLSLAIGRNGQNVRLASQLTGWKIEIETDETPSNT